MDSEPSEEQRAGPAPEVVSQKVSLGERLAKRLDSWEETLGKAKNYSAMRRSRANNPMRRELDHLSNLMVQAEFETLVKPPVLLAEKLVGLVRDRLQPKAHQSPSNK